METWWALIVDEQVFGVKRFVGPSGIFDFGVILYSGEDYEIVPVELHWQGRDGLSHVEV